ncbi:hypothetical protein IJ103_01485, partial [Candidatus Saccharibacteria bacterium]|nr:hypothetical protein [Candidatus Saccharibacteria bacterium]
MRQQQNQLAQQFFRTDAGVLSPSSGVRPGAKGIFHLSPLTSFGVLAVVLVSLLSISFFSDSAYASSYLNVSSGSGGNVTFGSIRPTSSS